MSEPARADAAGRRRRLALLALAGLGAPFLVRATLLIQHAPGPGLVDLAGLLSDCAAAGMIAALLEATIPRSRVAAFALALVWGLSNYASLEYVRELGAPLQLTFAHYAVDPTFFFGSFLAITSPLILLACLGCCLLPVYLLARSPAPSRHPLRLLGAALALMGLAWLAASDEAALAWRQHHFLQANIESLFQPGHSPIAGPTASGRPPAELAADLSGIQRFPLPGRARNVVLLVLEGLPGSVIHLEEQTSPPGELFMPHFSAIAAEGLSLTNFVLHQRQTNRGLYALLCGDYPKLDYSLAKMSAYALGESRACLPRILAPASYRSVYLQGAPLAFMYKDTFTKRAGFDEIYGNRHFEAPIHRSEWGVDDRSLLTKALELMDRLEGEESPYLLAILSVGTHHPAVVPGEYASDTTRSGFEQAVGYLDLALADFVEEARRRGLLDHTLLIITSDESRGSNEANDLHSALSRNWGPLVVLTPEARREVVPEPYAQSDVALSILDYLGIQEGGQHLIGRSLFRRYTATRRTYFGNVFLRRTGAVDSAGFTLFCDELGRRCTKFGSDPTALFRPRAARLTPQPEELERLQAALLYSQQNTTRLGSAFELELVGQSEIAMLGPGLQSLMDGQNLHLPSQSRVEVDIVLDLEATAGTLDLYYRFGQKGYKDIIERDLEGIAPGSRLVIRHGLATGPEKMRNVHFKLTGQQRGATDFDIRVERARVRVSPIARPTEGILLLGEPRFEISGPQSEPAHG